MSEMSCAATLLEEFSDVGMTAQNIQDLCLMEEESTDQLDLARELLRLTTVSMAGLKAGKKALDRRTLCAT